jgi:hypothetical protein
MGWNTKSVQEVSKQTLATLRLTLDLRVSRQSDSNRRPADYKSAALNQLSYAGAPRYESRF